MRDKPNKNPTQPGLGEATDLRFRSAEIKRIRDSFRREILADASPAPYRDTSDAPTECHVNPNAVRPKVDLRSVRLKAASPTRARIGRDRSPRLVATPRMIMKAPLDNRYAFVLSLIDGRTTVDELLDLSGMSEDELEVILERMTSLRLIALT
jgi:hypothetical protein